MTLSQIFICQAGRELPLPGATAVCGAEMRKHNLRAALLPVHTHSHASDLVCYPCLKSSSLLCCTPQHARQWSDMVWARPYSSGSHAHCEAGKGALRSSRTRRIRSPSLPIHGTSVHSCALYNLMLELMDRNKSLLCTWVGVSYFHSCDLILIPYYPWGE